MIFSSEVALQAEECHVASFKLPSLDRYLAIKMFTLALCVYEQKTLDSIDIRLDTTRSMTSILIAICYANRRSLVANLQRHRELQ